jgi:hypothetical protein
MRLSIYVIILFILVGNSALQAELGAVQTFTINNFKNERFGGSSAFANCKGYPSANGSEVVLTENKTQCVGSVLITSVPICAKDYEISMEIYSSQPLKSTGGLGIYIEEGGGKGCL